MDIQGIIQLIDAVSNANILNFEIEEGNFRLTMDKLKERKNPGEMNPAVMVPMVSAGTPAVSAGPIINPSQKMDIDVDQQSKIENNKDQIPAGVKEIKSPIVGTFYSASGPDAEDFVMQGSKVKKGQTLCIIEAMKLMNDIESEFDGEIIEVLVKNEQMVEYGQSLFKIRVDE